MSELPWNEKVVMLSMNPDAANRHDIAELAADLMEKCQQLAAKDAEIKSLAFDCKVYKNLVRLIDAQIESLQVDIEADKLNENILKAEIERLKNGIKKLLKADYLKDDVIIYLKTLIKGDLK